MPFDFSQAKADGWKDDQLVNFLGQSTNFDHETARKDGF